MYFFNHPHHTGGHDIALGDSEFTAAQALKDSYGIEAETLVPLLMGGYLWQKTIKAAPEEMDSVVDWLAQRG